MKRSFRLYSLFSILLVSLLGAYPLYMGVRVVADMMRYGAVAAEDYPKYLIPYTPVAVAVLTAAVVMPWLLRLTNQYAHWIAAGVSLVVFFTTEILFENLVIVTETVQTTLESWQMYMCYIPPDGISRCWSPIDMLIGDYSPWFKMHFYMIAVVLVLSVLNLMYGFGKQILRKQNRRTKPLILQAIATSLFLVMCILACFTAFFRTGELQVSPLSALLMSTFFVLLGVDVGLYCGSFFYGKRPLLAVAVPGLTAVATTFLMYIGEMCLLNGHLYQLGVGTFFETKAPWTLAAADMVITLGAGLICAVILWCIREKNIGITE